MAERLRSLGKGKKARKNQGDMGETAPLSPWEHESEYELVRGAYGPGSEMPPVNRRNPRRNPAPESVRYDDLSTAQLTFLSNTGDESASRELARRNPRTRSQRELADARAYARTQMDDETARMMAEQAEDEKRDYVRRRVQLKRKEAKGQYSPRHAKFGSR